MSDIEDQTPDTPQSLWDPRRRRARTALLHRPHIDQLTAFVDDLRAKTGYEELIPYFDPLDGGVEARCLFVFETPGPEALKSGFVSRDNPDPTAKNFFLLNEEAGLPRCLTISWNMVPWYPGSDGRNKRPGPGDARRGLPCLEQLLPLLLPLEVIVLTAVCVSIDPLPIISLYGATLEL